MRELNEIIEDCKLNKEADNTELKYAVITLTSLMNMASSTLRSLYKDDMNLFVKMKFDNIHNAYHTALNKSPKDWLGWNNDPENPEYQRFHAMGSRLVEKALKGELPNQKKQEG